MKEVSCRVFDVFLRRLEERGLSGHLLVAGTSTSLSTLRRPNERIDWSELVLIMRNARRIFTDDEYVDIGRQFLRSPMTRFMSVVGRVLFSAMDFYRWLNKAKDGAGNQMFTCITPTHRELGPNELEVDLTLAPGYEMSWDFFIVSKGMFMEVPRFVGLPAARVDLSRLEMGGRYRIHVPQGAPLITRARRAASKPFNAVAAARELKDAHESLQKRYEELDDARLKLDRQAAQLRTAHAIGKLIHGDLDLERTLDAITRALVEEAGFGGVLLRIRTEVDGVSIERSTERGERGPAAFDRDLLGGGGRALGSISVFSAEGREQREREALLDFVLPTLAMALENAISYRVLEEYRLGLERRVAERTAELSQARDALADTVAHLEEANATRDRIFANINHEIRTPLSLILLAVDRARRSEGPADRELDLVESSARRLLRLVDELLLLAEGREGDLQLRFASTNLSELVERIAEGWRSAAETGGFELRVDAAKACLASVDATAVERVLSNLLSNAMKYTPRGGTISVRVTASGGNAIVEVRDTGVGIDDELRARLFGRFERGRQAIASGVSGSGLGLSLVRELVEAHGGTIEVESPEEGGATFRMLWPLAEQAVPADSASEPQLGPEDFGVAVTAADERIVYACTGTAKATVLLAEDEPLLRSEIATLLAEEYRVIAAKDGVEALRLAKEHKPDLLVTDVAMPNMDGIELTRRFLSRAGNRIAPVLVLTAFGEVRDRLAGFDAGAVDYVVKPFDAAELRARVRSQLAVRALSLRLVEAERLASIGRLSAGLAHEIRNPANGILNAMEPLRDALAPAAIEPESPAGQLLDVIESCSRQIAVLARELLGFRRGAGLQRSSVRLELLIRRARASVWNAHERVELRERLEYDGALSCAEPLMQQVFSNLLDNAIYAAGPGGWVEIRSAVESGRVVVEFRDSGPGVPVDVRERLFEPFFTTKPPGSGTGLGLATAREIVSRHGGTLEVCGAPPATVFRIEMPQEAS